MRKGKSKINSISKIMKIKLIKKNCIEKENRLLFRGENPHSNGLNFFSSIIIFLDKKKPKLIKIKDKNILSIKIEDNMRIKLISLSLK